MSKSLRAVGMVAVSHERQLQGVSIDEQAKQIQERIDREGWDLNEMITLPGVSRTDPDIIEIFTSTSPKYAPYRRLRTLINNQAFDILVSYDNGRVGRSMSMFVYIAENCIANNIKVCILTSGTIDEDNDDFSIPMGSMAARAGVKRLKKMWQASMDRYAANGLPASKAPCMSHKVIHDPKPPHKPMRLELDESKAQLWQHLYTLVVDDVITWSRVEVELYERYGIVNQNSGRRYATGTMYHIAYNPNFWGHTGRYYTRKTSGESWVFDDDVPPPPGVVLYRHTIDPVFTGEQAEKLKAELRRRQTVIRGRNRPLSKYAFSGLLMCDICRRSLSVSTTRSRSSRKGAVYVCADAGPALLSGVCGQGKIGDTAIREFLSEYLSRLITSGDLAMLYPNREQADERPALLREIEKLREQMNDDMESQRLSRVASVKTQYRRLVDEAGERIDILESRLMDLNRRNDDIDATIVYANLKEIDAMGLPAFWQTSAAYQNQLLHGIFGRQRLIVRDGQVVGVDTYVRITGYGKKSAT